MPRPRKATAVLEANGATKKNPGRYRDRIAGEPVVTTKIGAPPAQFTKAQREAWLETVAEVPPGVLTGSDRTIVEVISYLKAEMRADPAKFTPQKVNQLRQCLGALGCTPSDRSRVSGAGATQGARKRSRLQLIEEGL